MATTFCGRMREFLVELEPDISIDKYDNYFKDKKFVQDDILDDMIESGKLTHKERYEFLDLIDFNLPIVENIKKSKSVNPKYATVFKEFITNTLWGYTRFIEEDSLDWVDPLMGDNVLRFASHHVVIAFYLDWQLRCRLHPAKGAIKPMTVSLPPQSAKSFLGSQYFPTLVIGNLPRENIIVCGYSDDFAKDVLMARIDQVVSSKGYKQLFANTFIYTLNDATRKALRSNNIPLPKSTDQAKYTMQGGYIIGRGITNITGIRSSVMCLDDGISNMEQAQSEKVLTKIKDVMDAVVLARLKDDSMINLIGTRFGERDPIGIFLKAEELLEKEIGEPTKTVNLSYRASYDEADNFDYDFRCKHGQILWSRYKYTTYMRLKVSSSVAVWESLYQNRPLSELGLIFRKEDFNFYSKDELPEKFIKLMIVVDTSYNANSTESDDASIIAIGVTPSFDYFVLDCVNKPLDFFETLDVLSSFVNQFPKYTEILVEDKANGRAVIETFSKRYTRVIPVPANDSKKARAMSVTSITRQNKVWLPNNDVGKSILNQLVAFTGIKGGKDDVVDTIVHAIIYADEQFRQFSTADDFKIIETKLNVFDNRGSSALDLGALNYNKDKFNTFDNMELLKSRFLSMDI